MVFYKVEIDRQHIANELLCHSACCWRIESGGHLVSEDGLRASIFPPKNKSTAQPGDGPVIQYIHG